MTSTNVPEWSMKRYRDACWMLRRATFDSSQEMTAAEIEEIRRAKDQASQYKMDFEEYCS